MMQASKETILSKYLSFFLPSAAGLWASTLFNESTRVWLVFANEIELHEAKLSIRAFHPELKMLTYPQWDTLPYAAASPSMAIQMQRQSVLEFLKNEATPCVVVSTLGALIQKVTPLPITTSTLMITAGHSLQLDEIAQQLSGLGFSRVETVYQPGEFSIRGGILDVFPSNTDEPYRVDLFGDDVESIHAFEPATQRRHTDKNLTSLTISSHQEILLTDQMIDTFKRKYVAAFGVDGRGDYYRTIVDKAPISGWEQLLPFFVDTPMSIIDLFPNIPFVLPAKGAFQSYLDDIRASYAYRKHLWDSAPTKDRQLPPIDPEELYISDFEHGMLRKSNTRIGSLLKHHDGSDIGVSTLNPFPQESVTDRLHAALTLAKKRNYTLICAVNEDHDIRYLKAAYESIGKQSLTVCTTWADIQHANDPVILWTEPLAQGFKHTDTLYITATELFGERKKTFKQRKTVTNPEDIISQATALNVGDLVVHRQHGIGQYLGLETINVFNVTHDCLALAYAGQDKLYLPVENIELLSRYGSDQGSVHLDKLGNTSWQSRQLKVKKQLRTIAKYLMDIAAKRMLKTAPVIEPNSGAFDEFCRRFKFVETEDQEKAIHDVIEDLAKGTPMDRLVCGDVGFGKTEVAMRAAFLVAQMGYQVGIIAPTTILARQHYYTFKKRFEGLDISIAQMSRLVKSSDLERTKKDVADGKVSILIGTHALLNKSIQFKNLGLLIIDEEQMFGVKQKERIKEMCDNIHVLTLTATPIPRTLQMSLLGIKEMSLIATPPVDRRAIQTTLCEEDRLVIHQAIRHEIDRQGQVFYVCPRIDDLTENYHYLTEAFPELNIVVAHGQLKPDEIESRLMEFISGKAHILLSTQIIESGIDISNANTMIIYNSHLFGLSQLYQLRGRIGRSTRQAYAYLIMPKGRTLTHTALKRLQVMSTLDTLGAGFTLASHDLDIRGAGNLLGEEQSGHIKDVGVELYQDMLKQAVNTLKKSNTIEPEEEDLWSPLLSLGLSVGLPESYIPDIQMRMELYRRFGTLTSNDAVNEARGELLDRFGRLPTEADNLISTIKIKILCRVANIQKVETGPNGVLFSFRHDKCGYVDQLLTLIQTNTQYKLRPDAKLFYQWSIDNIDERVKTVKRICKTLAGFNNSILANE